MIHAGYEKSDHCRKKIQFLCNIATFIPALKKAFYC